MVHPAIIILSFLVCIVVLAMVPNVALLVLLALIFFIGGMFDKHWWQRMLRSFKYTRLLLISIVVFHSAFTPGAVIFDLSLFTITQEGLSRGIYQASYLVAIVAGVQTLWTWLSREQMETGLLVLLYPLARLGVDIDRLAIRLGLVIEGMQHGLYVPSVAEVSVRAKTKNPVKLAAAAVVMMIDRINVPERATDVKVSYNAHPPKHWQWAIPILIGSALAWISTKI